VTGQQVGLFSGPAYTIFKALSAVKVAQHLSQNGVPAVPIFWLATEDHDLAEIDHAWIFNQDATPSKVSVANSVSNGGPVGDVQLGSVPFDELRSALGSLPFAEEVLGRVASAYQPGTTFGSAFRLFLKDVLKDFGLLYLDPLASEIRQIATPLMSEVVQRVPELVKALRQRDQDLGAAGYHSQVLVDDDASLLFLLENGKRLPIRFQDGRFVTRDRSYTTGELQAVAARLSPNALLRPVMQDFLFPTVSYIGGPAEIAYLAQSQVLYQHLLGRMPVIYPRNSLTLLDQRATKLLNRFDLHTLDLLDHGENVKGKIASKLVPGNLKQDFERLRSSTATSVEALDAKLAAFDPTLASASKKSTSKILYQMDKLARKVARETLSRDERASNSATYLMNLVYPHRRLQERIYSIVPFLAKYGLDLPHQLFSEIQLACPDHMVRTL
jgi:bacillithiol biosynthesis cysteine-adding enzyme BshC